jgi:hypothetical protein
MQVPPLFHRADGLNVLPTKSDAHGSTWDRQSTLGTSNLMTNGAQKPISKRSGKMNARGGTVKPDVREGLIFGGGGLPAPETAAIMF